MALPQIQCQLHDHAKQYDNDGACHSKRNGGRLHGNISRNGYGNAMIGRYGACFEEGIWWVYDTGEKCAVLERLAMVEGRKVRIIHGLNISHKELIYLLQKSTSYQSKVLRAGKDQRSSPTATHKEDNQKINHAPTSSHNGSPYVHATGITNFNTSIP